MTLLELSDSSHPLQRKLAAEAPGTYSHSMQVASLAEAASEAIGGNSLLARVGSLYHDIGKTRRPHYFCENQGGGENAHMSLSPEVSCRIIVEHIKDGLELARQHKLPTSLLPFIQQHHGTTLVEFFYHEACKQKGPGPTVAERDFRYPGPKPRSQEIAIVMLADACESASRAIPSPTPETIDKLVRQIVMKRLLDGQLSDCDLTMREIDIVEKTLARTLQSIHHGRVAYPDTARIATQGVTKVAIGQ
jgi:cyclic-di-AMP phosphodiesterase PgpH